MKTKDKKTLHTKDIKELEKLINEAYDLLVNLRLDKAQNKLKNPGQIFLKRKEIAQMLTIRRNKELHGRTEAKNEKTNK